MKLLLHAFDLPLRHAFTISRGSYRVQPTLIVQLDEDGLSGFGEATTNPYYGVTLEGMASALHAVAPLLAARRLDDPADLWDELRPCLQAHPFAQCALDQAAHDLWGQQQGQRVHRLWGLSDEQLPPSSYTIGIDRIDVMVARLREFPGWPVYKIKLGTPHDVAIVQALRRHTEAVFRVDANGAWSPREALDNARALEPLNVEFIEQPLPADQWPAMRELVGRSPLPLIADESCQTESDVERCHGCFQGVNIKAVKCGGLTPARRMIARARQLGMRTMIGCMTESSVGISAVAQLLPLVDYADLDGAVLLAEDIAEGVTLERGRCRFAPRPGTGARLRRPAPFAGGSPSPGQE